MRSPFTDIEDDLRAAIALTGLAEWISYAQETIERVRSAAARDPELRKLLYEHKACFNSPHESPSAGGGLQWLQFTIKEHLRGVEREAGLAADCQREATHG